MELIDIKKGLIFTLDWDRDVYCCVSKETKDRLLDIKSKIGHKIVFIYISNGKWVLGKDASSKVYPKQEILSNIKTGSWIPIKASEIFKGLSDEFEF